MNRLFEHYFSTRKKILHGREFENALRSFLVDEDVKSPSLAGKLIYQIDCNLLAEKYA